ncbi:MAG: P-loop NTPase [Desulfosudaceae bacterium]
MIIAIASGKGGTGKTTVATNLAVSVAAAGEKVKVLDCDVEEPNAHIFLKMETEERESVGTMVPEVDHDRCTGCGECDKICQFSAIALFGKAVLTFPEMCHSCEGCLMACPEEAISRGSRDLGELVTGKGKAGAVDLVYGSLRVGEAMSPPLIEHVKTRIEPDFINILDAPPGTSCPVITTLQDADFVLLVTEPTPFGLNDLKLSVEAVRVLGLPFGLVINRCDAGTGDTRQYAAAENIPVLMEIPDRRDIAEGYSRGRLMSEALPEMKDKFQALFTEVKNRVANPGAA